ncbi:hypothetical protein BGZ63DRAFT_349352 [Mariannaea sp. PMI_226]|jgi:hypothetical protein|nr:hypothetical protein BGZ63DRAFT_349352 [Mariannaea sp. PMI_226]
MKFTLATFVTLAAAVVAKPAFLNTNFDVQQNQPFTLKFSGCENGCTIVLLNGDSKDLHNYKTLTASATGDSFTFTPAGIPTDTYAFKITDNKSGEFNYSGQFEYQGNGLPTKSTTATTAAETTSSVVKTTSSVATTTVKKSTTLAKVTSTPVATPSHNSTTPVKTHASSTKAPHKTTAEGSSTAAPTSSATTVPDNGAARLSSSVALIAGAVMAMVYLN